MTLSPASGTPATTAARQEWKSYWPLLLSASVGFSFFSVMMAAVGLFIQPLGDEFGWSRTLLSAGPSVATVMTAILGPFFGVLIDKYGARRLALPGLVLTMAAVAAFSQVSGSEWQWLALWFVFGIVSVSIKSTIWTTAVVGTFDKSRGLALGLTLAGTAVAQMIVPPLANYLIETSGWRSAFVWLAIIWGGATLLLCTLFFHDARSQALKAIRERERSGTGPLPESHASAVELPGFSIPEATRSSTLWRLAISNFIVMALTMGLMIHLFPILTEAGVSREKAAYLLSLSGAAAILGKLVTGYLLDRFRPNLVGGLTLGAAALAFALLLDDITSPALIVIALMVNGYAAGTKTHITGFLTARYAGTKNFGAIYGFMSSLMALASGAGPLLAGYAYDIEGNYSSFLVIGALGCAIGGAIILTLPRYPDWASDDRV